MRLRQIRQGEARSRPPRGPPARTFNEAPANPPGRKPLAQPDHVFAHQLLQRGPSKSAREKGIPIMTLMRPFSPFNEAPANPPGRRSERRPSPVRYCTLQRGPSKSAREKVRAPPLSGPILHPSTRPQQIRQGEGAPLTPNGNENKPLQRGPSKSAREKRQTAPRSSPGAKPFNEAPANRPGRSVTAVVRKVLVTVPSMRPQQIGQGELHERWLRPIGTGSLQ